MESNKLSLDSLLLSYKIIPEAWTNFQTKPCLQKFLSTYKNTMILFC